MKKLIIGLTLTFLALQVADGLLTLWATNNGFQEVNPLMAGFANTWGFVLLKVPSFVVALGLWKVARRYPKAVAFGYFVINAFLGFILITNLSELFGAIL